MNPLSIVLIGVLITSSIVLLSFDDAFAEHEYDDFPTYEGKEPIRFYTIFASYHNDCGNLDDLLVTFYRGATSKMLRMYNFLPITSIEDCVNVSGNIQKDLDDSTLGLTLDEAIEKAKEWHFDLLVLILDDPLSFQYVKTVEYSGHARYDGEFKQVVITTWGHSWDDEPYVTIHNLEEDDSMWILSHEIAHFSLEYLGYYPGWYSHWVHDADKVHRDCFYNNKCDNSLKDPFVILKRHSGDYAVMGPPFENAVKQDKESLLVYERPDSVMPIVAENFRIVDKGGSYIAPEEIRVSNKLNFATDFTNVSMRNDAFNRGLKIQDSNGVTIQGTPTGVGFVISAGESRTSILSWTPTQPGIYEATIYGSENTKYEIPPFSPKSLKFEVLPTPTPTPTPQLPVSISVWIDKTSYQNGDIIIINGKVNNFNPNSKTIFMINEPSGELAAVELVKLYSNGEFSFSYPIDSLFTVGLHQLRITHGDSEGRTSFNFFNPKVSSVSIYTDKPSYTGLVPIPIYGEVRNFDSKYPVWVTIYDSSGVEVDDFGLIMDTTGKFSTIMTYFNKINPNAPSGLYSVKLEHQNIVDTAYFTYKSLSTPPGIIQPKSDAPPVVRIFLDKEKYQKGDYIGLYGSIENHKSSEVITLSLEDPNGKTILEKYVSLGSKDWFEDGFSSEPGFMNEEGQYTVKLSHGNYIDSDDFSFSIPVKETKPPLLTQPPSEPEPEPTCGPGTELVNGVCQVIRENVSNKEPSEPEPEPTCGIGTELVNGVCKVVREDPIKSSEQNKSFADILNEIFNPSKYNSQSNQDGKTCFLFWCW